MQRSLACLIGIGTSWWALGCGRLVSDDAGTDAGGADTVNDIAVNCQTGVFGNIVAITELNTSGDERGMRLSPDERNAVFGRWEMTDAGWSALAFQASRDSAFGPFAAPSALIAEGFYPSLTSDLLALFSEGGCQSNYVLATGSLCARERDGGTSVSFSFPFPAYGSLKPGPFGRGYAIGDGIVTSDAGTYYFVAPNEAGAAYAVFQAHRGDGPIIGTVFGAPTAQLAPNDNDVLVDNPVVSFDELTMFVSATSSSSLTPHIQVAERATTSDAFGPLSPVHELDSNEGEYPTWLSPDRCRLYFSRRAGGQWDLYVASRTE